MKLTINSSFTNHVYMNNHFIVHKQMTDFKLKCYYYIAILETI